MSSIEQNVQSVAQDIEAIKTVENSANYEGNHSVLLFKRVRNPFIQEQLIELLYKGELDHERTGDNFVVQENGKIVMISPNEVRTKNTPYIAKTKEELKAELFDRLRAVEHSTPITYEKGIEPSVLPGYGDTPDIEPPLASQFNREVMPIGFHIPGFTEPTAHTMSSVEAHEKGHVLRPFSGKFFDTYFKRGFDISKAVLTENDLPKVKEEESFEHIRENQLIYLFSANEIAERMSQLKSYFGFKGNEQFTSEHLAYAKANYIKDTKLNNSMSTFFSAITPETEKNFLELINSTGI